MAIPGIFIMAVPHPAFPAEQWAWYQNRNTMQKYQGNRGKPIDIRSANQESAAFIKSRFINSLLDNSNSFKSVSYILSEQ